MRDKAKPLKKRTTVVSGSNPKQLQDFINEAIEAIEEFGGNVLNVSHGAGVGVGKNDYGTRLKELYSAVVLFEFEEKTDETVN